MTKVIDHTALMDIPASRIHSLRSLALLRLIVGSLIVLGAMTTLVGVSWDIQWHDFVGRDRTLIPPHQMMLAGILFGGIVALVAVLIETTWARRNPELARYSSSFAGLFNCSLGTYIAGFAALDAAIAFPLDNYWHALYGIDVAIWAPFHFMILVGVGLMPLGASYTLISSAHLAKSAWGKRAAHIGMIIAFATMLGIFTLLLVDAVSHELGFIYIAGTAINLFPVLSGWLIAWTFIAAKYALPWRWAATMIILVYIGLAVVFTLFVPGATNSLVIAEGLSYREELGLFAQLSIVAMVGWFLAPIVVAPLLDLCFIQAKRSGWSFRTLMIISTLIALIACIPVNILDILFSEFSFLEIVYHAGSIGTTISLLLGLAGAFVGVWSGRRIGESIQATGRNAA